MEKFVLTNLGMFMPRMLCRWML